MRPDLIGWLRGFLQRRSEKYATGLVAQNLAEQAKFDEARAAVRNAKADPCPPSPPTPDVTLHEETPPPKPSP